MGFALRSRTALLSGSIASLLCLAAAAKIKDPSEYTLRATVLQVTQNQFATQADAFRRTSQGFHGSGYANVQEGNSWEGATFQFDGCPFFVRPVINRMARWKKGKEHKRLFLVVDGSGHDQFECELSIQMAGVLYGLSPTGTITASPKK